MFVEAGAWLHQLHDPNLDTLQSVLSELRVSSDHRDQLFEIVEQCRLNKISAHSSHEARVVFDANAGDLMGPAGILREVLCKTKILIVLILMKMEIASQVVIELSP